MTAAGARRALVIAVLGLQLVAATPGAAETAVEDVRATLADTRLRLDLAVAVERLRLRGGPADFLLESGVLVPVQQPGGRIAELVFAGLGRMRLEPDDDIEAQQLLLHTGDATFEENFRAAVLVVAADPAVASVLGRPRAAASAPGLVVAEETYRAWREGAIRSRNGLEIALLFDAAGDPAAQGYFAAWFEHPRSGHIFYEVDPDRVEQVSLGWFEPLSLEQRQARKVEKALDKAQRRGRLLSARLEDLGTYDVWTSAALRDGEGRPRPGGASYEPEHYRLDVSLDDRARYIDAEASLTLRALRAGRRVIRLSLQADLTVEAVTDGDGSALAFHRQGADLGVVLPAPPDTETVDIVVHYGGRLIEKHGRARASIDTIQWYPHAGTVDRATYDVTVRWPESLGLVATGRRVDGGVDPGGRVWQRRVLDRPASAFGFEVGRFDFIERQAGRVRVVLAHDPQARRVIDKGGRVEILDTVCAALLFFEEVFGPYPHERLEVVTVPRLFSQSLPGLVTLSTGMVMDDELWGQVLGLDDRRFTIAHEVAHQWWGHEVGWSSYRDQWISEALATWSARAWSRSLPREQRPERTLLRDWPDRLTATLADGRSVESVGPIVLGERLASSKTGDAYFPIVYLKGALVIDMLAAAVGEERFRDALRTLVEVVDGRAIDTTVFLAALERATGTDLTRLRERYVDGTGIPEVVYDYSVEARPSGGWTVRGRIEQWRGGREIYTVVTRADGSFDVGRRFQEEASSADRTMVVPIQVAIHDPARGARSRQGVGEANALWRGRVVLDRLETPFQFHLDHQPIRLWIDLDHETLALFHDRRTRPKDGWMREAQAAEAAGEVAAAERAYRAVLDAELTTGGVEEAMYQVFGRSLARAADVAAQMALARLLLDQDRDAEARELLERVGKQARSGNSMSDRFLRTLERLWARLELRVGDAEQAWARLDRNRLREAEWYLLRAVAAQATGRSEEARAALGWALRRGGDPGALEPLLVDTLRAP